MIVGASLAGAKAAETLRSERFEGFWMTENRVVAGIHYPVDILAGQAVAHRTFQDIRNVASIWTDLRNAVRGEFPQYAR